MRPCGSWILTAIFSGCSHLVTVSKAVPVGIMVLDEDDMHFDYKSPSGKTEQNIACRWQVAKSVIQLSCYSESVVFTRDGFMYLL